MKLLVTGGAGFIGSAVVRLAVARGHEVVNLDAMTYAANPANVASVAGSNLYTFARADIRNRPRLDQVFDEYRPDAVMHLAAESHVDRSIDGPADFIERIKSQIDSGTGAVAPEWRSRIKLVASHSVEATMIVDDAIIETRLGQWLARVEEAIR